MPLWLDHLLEDPGLGLDLVAGRGGLRSRGPIRWVHSSELADPTPWLEGGEVLLTTGMGVVDSPELQRKLIAGLDARGCAAVGFGIGVVVDDVPEGLRDEAEARDLPLFTVPYAVPFIAVTKRISRQIFDEHYATLRSAVDLHRQVLATVLSGAGLDAVLRTVGRALPDHRFALVDYYGEPLAGVAGQGGHEVVSTAWAALEPRLREADRVEAPVGERTAVGAAVRLGEQVEAYLLMLGDRPAHEHEALLLEQALTGVSVELARGQSVRETHRVRVDDLLDEATTGRLVGQVLCDRLGRVGVDVAAGYAVLCLRRPEQARTPRRGLVVVVEDALSGAGMPVLGRWQGELCAIVPSGDDATERVVAALRTRGWDDVTVGRSHVRHAADGLQQSIREAHLAAGEGVAAGASGLVEVASVGLAGLLAGLDGALGAEAFVDQVLGPVLAHDRREGTNLVASLRAYQAHGCRPGPAAAELQIHRHTLTYRLDRIRDLTGRDPRDGTHLLAFGLAAELAGRAPGPAPGRGSGEASP